MLETKLQIFILTISFLFIIFIFHFVRKEILELKYTIVWIITGLIIILIAFLPQSITIFSKLIGIKLPINALFFMSLFFILVIVFTMTVAISKLSLRITKLAQEISILKFKVENFNEENQKKKT